MSKKLNKLIEGHIKNHINTSEKFASQINEIENVSKRINKCIQSGGKLLICGNGGSAADSQHFAAEIVGRYSRERNGLPAIALTTDSSIITAISNDYNFEKIFSRQVEVLAQKKDILVAISTSGNSKNILNALKAAKSRGIQTVAFLGNEGGKAKSISDKSIIVPSNVTAHIQEIHILLIHIICMIIDECNIG